MLIYFLVCARVGMCFSSEPIALDGSRLLTISGKEKTVINLNVWLFLDIIVSVSLL